MKLKQLRRKSLEKRRESEEIRFMDTRGL